MQSNNETLPTSDIKNQPPVDEVRTTACTKPIQDFAKAIVKKLGRERAIQLLERELNAPYGRTLKQDTVAEAVGDDATRPVTRFLSISRDHNVDTWLQGAVEWINSTPQQQPK